MNRLIATIILAGTLTGLVLYYLFPVYWFPWYPLIPAYFVVLGIITSLGTNHHNKQTLKKFALSFLFIRGIKIALTLCFLLIYRWLINENIKEAVIITIAFYMLHLIVETCLFYRFEKTTKQNG